MEPNSQPKHHALAVSRILEHSLTQSGSSILDLSATSRVLLVFLRHAGCSFCREALGDLARTRSAIEQTGARIVLVHMGDTQDFEALLLKYGLRGVDCISDPHQQLYGAFGVKRGSLRQLLGPKVLWRGLAGGVLARHGLGSAHADTAQMPAIFLIHKAEIVRRFRHRTAADRPDYVGFCAPVASPAKPEY